MKIDDELARRAVACGPRLGVLITFPPSRSATEQLLRDTADALGTRLTLKTVVSPDAYDALLQGRASQHGELLLEAVARLRADSVDAVVLSQVSMARVLPLVPPAAIPVLSSLPLSLEAIRAKLAS